MFKAFQILKDNGDGTIDIEVPVYKKFTVPHPTDINGQKLSGTALVFMLNKWVLENAGSEITTLDISAAAFIAAFGVDSTEDGPIDAELLGLSAKEFPVPYAG